MDWVRSLNKALDYIETHISDDISCAEVSKHVYISVTHLQRTFFSLTGITFGEYVRNRRLTLAGQELLCGKIRVIDAAYKYGYTTPESFSKAFYRFHGVYPYRTKARGTHLKSYNRLTLTLMMEGGSVMDYRIEKRDAFTVVLMARTFDGSDSGSIPAFWSEYFENTLWRKVPGMMGVCLGSEHNGNEFFYGIGCAAEQALEIPDGFKQYVIPAGTWAVFKCVGAMPDAIQKLWKDIYSQWFPTSIYEALPSWEFEYYYNGDNQSPDYVSEIWIPVKEKE